MKKINQNLKNGNTELLLSPMPSLKIGHLLIKSEYSIISLGTEKMLVDFGKANLLKKATLQPDKAKKAIAKVKTDGLIPTIKSILNKLDEPLSLGYSNAGIIYGIGPNVTGYKIGDRVISNGPHSEYFNSPVNLCAKIPSNVLSKEASFTVLGSISLQSIRLLKPLIGETIYVFGMGLIGLIAVQILINNGCNVIAIDYNNERLDKAKLYGADVVLLTKKASIVNQINKFSSLEPADGVIIATNTKSNEPLDLASSVSRKKGRIILVGDSGINVNRTEFYNKELTFQVSRSYGPGRYDKNYEEEGIDYPIEYVRWTQKRNFEAILQLLRNKKLDFKSLITHQFTIEEVTDLYDTLNNPSFLGVIIKYKKETSTKTTIFNNDNDIEINPKSNLNTGFIGAGNYCRSVLLPAFIKTDANMIGIASLNGASAAHAGKKFGLNYFTSDAEKIINDKNITNIVIATQHNTHFEFVEKALKKNKKVFVEKPLCLTLKDLDKLKKTVLLGENKQKNLTVGFNRRFSPLAQTLKNNLENEKSHKVILINVNAGHIEDNHWTQSKSKGGGRIIGEAIHFIDLARFLSGQDIEIWKCSKAIGKSKDTCSIILEFKGGSIANINYISTGSNLYPKEKITVFCNGQIAEIDNFKKLKYYNWPGTKNKTLFVQNKGQNECISSFINSSKYNLGSNIPFKEIYQVHKTAIEIVDFINQ